MAQRARSNTGDRGEKKFVPRQEERSAFVPRYIEAQYRAIKEVIEVKPYESTPRLMAIIVVLNRKYDSELHTRLLMLTQSIERNLKERNQKFEASFGW